MTDPILHDLLQLYEPSCALADGVYDQARASTRDRVEVANKCVGRCRGCSLSSGDVVSPLFSTDLPEAIKFRASGMANENQHKEHIINDNGNMSQAYADF